MKTKATDAAWLRRVQIMLDGCPNPHWRFYTIGDPGVTVYNVKTYEIGCAELGIDPDDGDIVSNLARLNREIDCDPVVGVLNFPANVDGVCG